uniref:NADPH-dependent F420 reductase n=1 Tax=Flavobacterium sp. TaxID=239 RepID=UPI00404AB7C4
MKIAFIGIGNVGFAIANRLQKMGHEIIVAHDDLASESVRNALAKNNNFTVSKVQEAVDAAEIIFLATPFSINESILKDLDFHNKPLVDCTNPVGMGISHGLKSEISGAEKVQEWASSAKVVKAFTIYGFENFENNDFPNYNVKPLMMIAGNDLDSKNVIAALATALGFESLDTGNLDQALHLEHMTLLWVKMVRRDGKNAKMVWAKLS